MYIKCCGMLLYVVYDQMLDLETSFVAGMRSVVCNATSFSNEAVGNIMQSCIRELNTQPFLQDRDWTSRLVYVQTVCPTMRLINCASKFVEGCKMTSEGHSGRHSLDITRVSSLSPQAPSNNVSRGESINDLSRLLLIR